jgi:Haem-binding domain/Cytochrome P460
MKTSTKKKVFRTILVLFAGFVIIQFIRPKITNPPVTGDVETPADVKVILKRACYDCHSNQTNLRWYDKIAPIYWKVAEHVKDGRKGLNFSTWDKLPAADQKAKLWEAVNQICQGAMPLKDYEMVHTDASVSASDLAVLKNYLAGTVHLKADDTAKTNAADKQYKQWQKTSIGPNNVPVAANGVAYIADYKNWQPMSTSERFDNGTMRVIFGNDVAVKAVKDNNIHPWPNGTVFAKVAWKQLADKDGNIHTGEFLQVEFMIKNAQKYTTTKGWGFARFKTPKMVPYGKNAMFATECIDCHRPLKNEDFVFTQPVKQ